MRLIDANTIKEKSYYSDDGYLVVDVSDIDDAPTVEQNNEWVPVSERLPEEGGDVLLCFKEGSDCPYYQIQVGNLGTHVVEDNNFEQIGVATVWYTDKYYYDFDQVSAWMPRPKPYKGDEDEAD